MYAIPWHIFHHRMRGMWRRSSSRIALVSKGILPCFALVVGSHAAFVWWMSSFVVGGGQVARTHARGHRTCCWVNEKASRVRARTHTHFALFCPHLEKELSEDAAIRFLLFALIGCFCAALRTIHAAWRFCCARSFAHFALCARAHKLVDSWTVCQLDVHASEKKTTLLIVVFIQTF